MSSSSSRYEVPLILDPGLCLGVPVGGQPASSFPANYRPAVGGGFIHTPQQHLTSSNILHEYNEQRRPANTGERVLYPSAGVGRSVPLHSSIVFSPYRRPRNPQIRSKTSHSPDRSAIPPLLEPARNFTVRKPLNSSAVDHLTDQIPECRTLSEQVSIHQNHHFSPSDPDSFTDLLSASSVPQWSEGADSLSLRLSRRHNAIRQNINNQTNAKSQAQSHSHSLSQLHSLARSKLKPLPVPSSLPLKSLSVSPHELLSFADTKKLGEKILAASASAPLLQPHAKRLQSSSEEKKEAFHDGADGDDSEAPEEKSSIDPSSLTLTSPNFKSGQRAALTRRKLLSELKANFSALSLHHSGVRPRPRIPVEIDEQGNVIPLRVQLPKPKQFAQPASLDPKSRPSWYDDLSVTEKRAFSFPDSDPASDSDIANGSQHSSRPSSASEAADHPRFELLIDPDSEAGDFDLVEEERESEQRLQFIIQSTRPSNRQFYFAAPAQPANRLDPISLPGEPNPSSSKSTDRSSRLAALNAAFESGLLQSEGLARRTAPLTTSKLSDRKFSFSHRTPITSPPPRLEPLFNPQLGVIAPRSNPLPSVRASPAVADSSVSSTAPLPTQDAAVQPIERIIANESSPIELTETDAIEPLGDSSSVLSSAISPSAVAPASADSSSALDELVNAIPSELVFAPENLETIGAADAAFFLPSIISQMAELQAAQDNQSHEAETAPATTESAVQVRPAQVPITVSSSVPAALSSSSVQSSPVSAAMLVAASASSPLLHSSILAPESLLLSTVSSTPTSSMESSAVFAPSHALVVDPQVSTSATVPISEASPDQSSINHSSPTSTEATSASHSELTAAQEIVHLPRDEPHYSVSAAPLQPPVILSTPTAPRAAPEIRGFDQFATTATSHSASNVSKASAEVLSETPTAIHAVSDSEPHSSKSSTEELVPGSLSEDVSEPADSAVPVVECPPENEFSSLSEYLYPILSTSPPLPPAEVAWLDLLPLSVLSAVADLVEDYSKQFDVDTSSLPSFGVFVQSILPSSRDCFDSFTVDSSFDSLRSVRPSVSFPRLFQDPLSTDLLDRVFRSYLTYLAGFHRQLTRTLPANQRPPLREEFRLCWSNFSRLLASHNKPLADALQEIISAMENEEEKRRNEEFHVEFDRLQEESTEQDSLLAHKQRELDDLIILSESKNHRLAELSMAMKSRSEMKQQLEISEAELKGELDKALDQNRKKRQEILSMRPFSQSFLDVFQSIQDELSLVSLRVEQLQDENAECDRHHRDRLAALDELRSKVQQKAGEMEFERDHNKETLEQLAEELERYREYVDTREQIELFAKLQEQTIDEMRKRAIRQFAPRKVAPKGHSEASAADGKTKSDYLFSEWETLDTIDFTVDSMRVRDELKSIIKRQICEQEMETRGMIKTITGERRKMGIQFLIKDEKSKLSDREDAQPASAAAESTDIASSTGNSDEKPIDHVCFIEDERLQAEWRVFQSRIQRHRERKQMEKERIQQQFQAKVSPKHVNGEAQEVPADQTAATVPSDVSQAPAEPLSPVTPLSDDFLAYADTEAEARCGGQYQQLLLQSFTSALLEGQQDLDDQLAMLRQEHSISFAAIEAGEFTSADRELIERLSLSSQLAELERLEQFSQQSRGVIEDETREIEKEIKRENQNEEVIRFQIEELEKKIEERRGAIEGVEGKIERESGTIQERVEMRQGTELTLEHTNETLAHVRTAVDQSLIKLRESEVAQMNVADRLKDSMKQAKQLSQRLAEFEGRKEQLLTEILSVQHAIEYHKRELDNRKEHLENMETLAKPEFEALRVRNEAVRAKKKETEGLHGEAIKKVKEAERKLEEQRNYLEKKNEELTSMIELELTLERELNESQERILEYRARQNEETRKIQVIRRELEDQQFQKASIVESWEKERSNCIERHTAAEKQLKSVESQLESLEKMRGDREDYRRGMMELEMKREREHAEEMKQLKENEEKEEEEYDNKLEECEEKWTQLQQDIALQDGDQVKYNCEWDQLEAERASLEVELDQLERENDDLEAIERRETAIGMEVQRQLPELQVDLNFLQRVELECSKLYLDSRMQEEKAEQAKLEAISRQIDRIADRRKMGQRDVEVSCKPEQNEIGMQTGNIHHGRQSMLINAVDIQAPPQPVKHHRTITNTQSSGGIIESAYDNVADTASVAIAAIPLLDGPSCVPSFVRRAIARSVPKQLQMLDQLISQHQSQ